MNALSLFTLYFPYILLISALLLGNIFFKAFPTARVADPVGVDSDPDPTIVKKIVSGFDDSVDVTEYL